jgi:hypothetical protein
MLQSRYVDLQNFAKGDIISSDLSGKESMILWSH